MHFQDMNTLLTDLRIFVKENPTAYITIHEVHRFLWTGFSALLDDETTKEWTIGIAQFRSAFDQPNCFSPEEVEIIKNYHSTRSLAGKAQDAYIQMMTKT